MGSVIWHIRAALAVIVLAYEKRQDNSHQWLFFLQLTI